MMDLDLLYRFSGEHLALRSVIQKIQAMPEDSAVQYRRLVQAVLVYLHTPRPVDETQDLLRFLQQVVTTCPVSAEVPPEPGTSKPPKKPKK